MAGKSSLLRSLIDHTSPNRLTSETERTIGLDIKRLNLPDPRQRAVNGVELEAYDAGGHNEYQEMLLEREKTAPSQGANPTKGLSARRYSRAAAMEFAWSRSIPPP